MGLMLTLGVSAAWSQLPRSSQQLAKRAIDRWPATQFAAPNDRGHAGLMLEAVNEEWLDTADPIYFDYARSAADAFIAAEDTHSTDGGGIEPWLGREVLQLYRVTQQESYWKLAAALHERLIARQASGAGVAGESGSLEVRAETLYETEPFLAEYARTFQQPADFSAITERFVRAGRDARTVQATQRARAGLLAALVDTLPSYARSEPGRDTLLEILRSTAQAAASPHRTGSGSATGAAAPDPTADCMIAYALARAARLGYLPSGYAQAAKRVWHGTNGPTSLTADDPEAAGAQILAAREMEMAPLARLGGGRVALVDAWFNSQQRKNAAGQMESFHYKWDDASNNGFSLLGHLFNDYGVATETLSEAPTAANLQSAQFYLIVSPDIPVKNPHPHYATREDAAQVAAWVRQGGILLLMENDPANADIDHLNLIADVFGLHFNSVLSHHVDGDNFAMGRIDAAGGGALFKEPHILFMKDTCTLKLSGPARPLLVDKGDVMMAAARYGKGTVYAVVDPWLYNEYTDGRKLPREYDNFAGAGELLSWLMRQLPSRVRPSVNH